MYITPTLLSFFLGALTAFGFTFFQYLTLNMKIQLKTPKFIVAASLNLFYGYLLWISFRAIRNSFVSIQIIMAISSTFVSWLSFAIISRQTDGELSINKRQAIGFVVGVVLTIMEELNKRLILSM